MDIFHVYNTKKHLDFVLIKVVSQAEKGHHFAYTPGGQHGSRYRVFPEHLQKTINSLLGTHKAFDRLEIRIDNGITQVEFHLPDRLLYKTKVAEVVVRGTEKCVLSVASTICDVPIWSWSSAKCKCGHHHKLNIINCTQPHPTAPLVLPQPQTEQLPEQPQLEQSQQPTIQQLTSERPHSRQSQQPSTPTLISGTESPSDRRNDGQQSIPFYLNMPGQFPSESSWDTQVASAPLASDSTSILDGVTISGFSMEQDIPKISEGTAYHTAYSNLSHRPSRHHLQAKY